MATTTFNGSGVNFTYDPGVTPNGGASAAGVPTNGIQHARVKSLCVWPFASALGTATYGTVTFYDGTGSGASATASALGAFTVSVASAGANGTTFPAGPVIISPINMPFNCVSGLMAVWVSGNNCTSARMFYEWDVV